MTKKHIALIAAFGIAVSAFVTGCSDKKNKTSETTTESQTETQAEEVSSETAEVSDEVTEIGESIDDTSPNYDNVKGETISETKKVNLKNETGHDITDISYVGSIANEDEPLSVTYDDMIMGSVFKKDAAADMVYPVSYHTPDDEDTVTEFDTLSLDITFENDECAELHSFKVEDDVEEVSLCYEDEVLYLTYKDKDGNDVSTKEDEIAFDGGGDADVEKSAAAEQNNNSADDEKSHENNDDNGGSGDTKYEEVKQTEAPAAAETAAPAEAEPKATEKPAENADGGNNAENNNGGDADPNGGCLGNEGLFY